MRHQTDIRDYLQNHKLLTDGAFGTYFPREDLLPEKANTEAPELVEEIHRAYLEAGAVLLRTNTFASNTKTLGCEKENLAKNLKAAVAIADKAIAGFCKENAEKTCFLAGDIGPIPEYDSSQAEETREEYLFIAMILAEVGVDALVFETFADLEIVKDVITQIKKRYPKLFIITQFSVNQIGFTNAGLSAKTLMEEADRLAKDGLLDAAGFNCGVGPGHLHRILKTLQLSPDLYITALPNASYPKLVRGKVVFQDNADYFAEKLCDIAELGADIVGGCCGTNPSYIRMVSEQLSLRKPESGLGRRKQEVLSVGEETKQTKSSVPAGAFYKSETSQHKLIAVELSPPPNGDDRKIMDAAHMLERFGVDVVTFPDSPSGRTRTDSVLMAAKVAKETGLCVMPHICCRDKNAIAIRSLFLGAFINGVRNVLLITGDPVPTMIRENVKSVFNFDSVGLMKILREMNEDEFAKDAIAFGGAINQNRLNLDVEIKRIRRKMEAGATFFLTQPVFSPEDVGRLQKIKEETGARVLCGIMPLISLKNALFIKNEMAGIHVTEEIVTRFRADMTREEGEAVGISIARDVMDMTKDVTDGYYFSIPFNRVYLLEEILKG